MGLAGGGYTKTNVARCWTYETAKLVGRDIASDIPSKDMYYDYYAPGHSLNLTWSRNDLTNHNPLSEQQAILATALENLRRLRHAPGTPKLTRAAVSMVRLDSQS